MTVNGVNDAPSITPTAPESNQELSVTQNITAEANASDLLDANGYIKEVQFRLGANGAWESDVSAPYSVSFGKRAVGDYVMYFRAKDNSDAFSPILSRNFKVRDLPQADIESIADETRFAKYSPTKQPIIGELKGKTTIDGGAFSYSLPVPLPPGRAGMQPSVSLNYNSQQGEGLAGVGWNLSASESISRCSSVYELDDVAMNPVMSSEDKLCFNGSRLLRVQGANYGESGAVYTTERDPDVRIEQSGSINNNASFFTLYYPNGNKSYFGSSFDSRVIYSGHASVSRWLLAKQVDASNNINNVKYEYLTEIGNRYLSKIYYTGTGDQNGNRIVSFDYDTIESSVSYMWGGKSISNRKLDKIDIEIAGTTRATFDLHYMTSNPKQLEKVSYCNALDETECVETSFAWQQESLGYTGFGASHEINSHLASASFDDKMFYLAHNITSRPDLDGDGVQELFVPGKGLRLSYTGEYKSFGNYQPESRYAWFPSEVGAPVIYTDENNLTVDLDGNLHSLNIFKGQLDYDLDGRADEIYVNDQNEVVIHTAQDILAGNNSSPSYRTGIDGTCYPANSPIGRLVCFSIVTDINGDGRSDFILATNSDRNSASVTYKMFIRSATSGDFMSAGEVASLNMAHSMTGMDVNGDGLVDLAPTSFDKTLVWYEATRDTAGNYSYTRRETTFNFNFDELKRSDPSKWADFNGDGLQDVLSLSLVGSNDAADGKYTWVVALNRGNGVFEAPVSTGRQELAIPGSGLTISGDEGYVFNSYVKVLDYNGDGRQDLLIPNSSRRKYTYECWNWSQPMPNVVCADSLDNYPKFSPYDVWYWNVLITNEDGIGFTEITTDIYGALSLMNVVDYNGDGKDDIVSSLGTEDPTDERTWFYGAKIGGPPSHYERNFVLFQRDSAKDTQVSQVITGRGAKFKVTYGKLGDNRPEDFQQTFEENYPYINFTDTATVVTAVESDNGKGGFNTTQYQYGNARFHLAGRGFQGFAEVVETDVAQQLQTKTQFSQTFPYSGMVIAQQVSALQSSAKYLISEFVVDELAPLNYISGTPYCYYPKSTTEFEYALNADVGDVMGVGAGYKRKTTTSVINNEYCQEIEREVSIDTLTFGKSSKVVSIFDNEYDAGTCVDSSQKGLSLICESKSTSSISYKVHSYNGSKVETIEDSISSKEFEYNGQLKVETIFETANIATNETGATGSKTSFEYDNYGNNSKVSKSNNNGDGEVRWTSFDYGFGSTDFYFIGRTFNSQWGNSLTATEPTTDPLTGQVLTSKDVNGFTTFKTVNFIGLELSIWTENASGAQLAPTIYKEYDWGQVSVVQDGAATSTTYTDSLGRIVKSTLTGFGGETITSETVYDETGNVLEKHTPTAGYGTQLQVEYSNYDVLGRPGTKMFNDGVVSYTSSYRYDGINTFISVVTGGKTLTMERTYNALNQLIRTKDANSGESHFQYNALGAPVYIEDVLGNAITAKYDGFGRKLSFNDPNMGEWHFTFNEFGELANQTDANGKLTVFQYDQLGRLVNRGGRVFVFDKNEDYGRLSESEYDGKKETLTYNALGQVSEKQMIIDGAAFQHSFAYDSYYGRIKAEKYASGEMVAYEYNQQGYVSREYQAFESGSTQTLRTINEMTALGAIKTQTYGNGLVQRFTYHDSGAVDFICTGRNSNCSNDGIQRIDYRYDSMGNVVLHDNQALSLSESYQYDSLMRLDYATVHQGSQLVGAIDYDYDAAGNIKLKTDYATNFIYGNDQKNAGGRAGPNAVRQVTRSGSNYSFSYDENGNMKTGIGLSVDYNDDNKPISIIRSGITSTFNYDANGMRYKQESNGTTTYYIDKSVTREVSTTGIVDKTYVGNHSILVTQVEGMLTAASDIIHTTTDRLGSVDLLLDGSRHVNSVTNIENLVQQYRNYDAFGRPRNVSASSFHQNTSANLLTDWADVKRGFTSHEHLPESELIHMNGRVFDYNLGRFMSVDPYIQMPTNTQSLNPYSYILNNPMAGTDPTGYRSCTPGAKLKGICGDDANSGGSVLGFQSNVRIKNGKITAEFKVVKKNGQKNESSGSVGDKVGDVGKKKSTSGGSSSGDEYLTPKGTHDFGTAEIDGKTYKITATFGSQSSELEGNPYSMPENVVTVAGLAAGVAEHGKHPYWLAANGKIYPSKWGGNQHTGGKNKAIAKAKGLASKLGKGLFFTYAGVRAVDAVDKITTMRAAGDMEGVRSEAIDAGLDVIVGSIGVWGGPVGWGIAGVYWIADEFVFDGNLAQGVSQWFRREEEYSN